ncbi:MAG: hypothetical protein GF398_21825 [Chitinivibrionales bacterium]|nr:hypothetical protein [Chitinivibrionales bacterium]
MPAVIKVTWGGIFCNIGGIEAQSGASAVADFGVKLKEMAEGLRARMGDNTCPFIPCDYEMGGSGSWDKSKPGPARLIGS